MFDLKRILGCAFAVTFALFAAGCSRTGQDRSNGDRHAYTRPHVLRYAALGDITGLDGFVHRGNYAYLLDELCGAFLIRTDPKGNATVPELATVIPTQKNGGISADGKTITWHLRRGVKWSDGAPFSADDVVFSTQQMRNPANNVEQWNYITKVDEPDKFTVVYHMSKPLAAYAITFFSSASYSPVIIPKHLLGRLKNLNEDSAYDSLPVGIGPFKFAQWKRGESVTMVRNPLYWRGSPKLERVIFKIVPDRNTTLAQLHAHEIDLWVGLSAPFYHEATKLPDIRGLRQGSPWFEDVGFNVASPILRDVRVRRALRLAMDRDTYLRKIDFSLNTRSESYVSKISPFYVGIPLVPFDLDRANELLDADGWRRGTDGIRMKDGKRLSLRWAALSGTSDNDRAIELVRTNWSRIGVELLVTHYPFAVLHAPENRGGILTSGEYDIRDGFTSPGPLPDMSAIWACDQFPPNGSNFSRWCDPHADEEMKRLNLTYDFHTQKAASDAVVRAMVDQVPMIILDSRDDLAAYSSDLKNFHPNANSTFDSMIDVDI